MRFRFCGDLDCPDWLLSEINTLSKLSSLKVKLLCNEVVKSILEEEVEVDKVFKLTADAKLDEDDTKAIMAALTQILKSAVRYGVSAEVLSEELQQLGLPKEHSGMVCRCYSNHHQQLHHHSTLFISLFPSPVSLSHTTQHLISSSTPQDLHSPIIRLKLALKKPDAEDVAIENFSISTDKLQLLLAELQRARKIMAHVESF